MVAAGCAAAPPSPGEFTAETGAPASAVAEPRVISEITTDEGATLRFMNERAAGDDPVISVEIVSPAATAVLDAVLAQEPSALELYRAVRPGHAAPADLVREHALIAAHDPRYAREPRTLAAVSVAGAQVTEPVACGSLAAWTAAFEGWAPVLDGQYEALETASTTGYVGYAPKFYFDVCRLPPISSFAYVARTERRSSAAAAWAVFDDGSPLGANQRYRFFRNTFTCSSFQYRLFVGVAGGGAYYRGARWSDEWSCQLTTGG